MLKRLFANLLDQALVFIVSVVLMFILQGIMKVAGFKMKEAAEFLIIIYAIVNVLYYPILEGCKGAATIGKRLVKLD